MRESDDPCKIGLEEFVLRNYQLKKTRKKKWLAIVTTKNNENENLNYIVVGVISSMMEIHRLKSSALLNWLAATDCFS